MSEITITGKVKRLKKLENDFNIAFIQSKDIEDKYKTDFGTFVVQGIGSFSENETLTFKGEWHYNGKYNNWAFKFIDFDRKKPEKKEEIVAYLQSQIFKGIGPIIAERIVDKFKEQTLEIIDSTPERLKEIEGIGAKKYENMMSTYKGGEAYKQLIKLLVPPPISLPASTVARIHKSLGKTAISKMEENPYILCEKVSRVSFRTADFIAREKFKVAVNDMSRVRAGIMYVLNQASMNNGHMYLPIIDLYNDFKKIIPEIKLEEFNYAIRLLNGSELKVIVNNNNRKLSPVMLKKYYNMEKNISTKIKELIKKGKKIPNLERYIREIEEELGIKYAKNQLEALRQIDKSNLFVITGGPGTGKSTIINGILKILSKHNHLTKVLMAAPTGRASKRMEETTEREAATIHRTLEFKPAEGFTRNAENPLDADVIIIDESSMIDIPLMNSLIKAIQTKTKVIFVGDIDQRATRF